MKTKIIVKLYTILSDWYFICSYFYPETDKELYRYSQLNQFHKSDDEIAKDLGMTLDDYHNILISHNAIVGTNSTFPLSRYIVKANTDIALFKNKEDAERALEHLTPYIIMAKLTE